MDKISAVIITRNEAKNIGRCLASLQDVADEIIVVDAHSDDHTVEICRQHGAQVYLKDWEGYAANKNFGNERATHHHILSLDADEVLSPELARAIVAEKAQLKPLYSFNRLTNYCGQWIRHCGWYPDPKLRLFDRRIARWEGPFVHEYLACSSDLPVCHLPGDLWHYSFRSLSDHLQRVDRYSTLAAQELHNKKAGGLWGKLLTAPPLKFFKCYVLKKGCLDGFYGFCICAISAFDIFIRYAKAISLNKTGN